MKNITIGTAGHIDHGKTCLIKALTGIDTDKLPEEKKRGITIEPGYTHLSLPGLPDVGIVDVPGHDRFIANMLTGTCGINMCMLLIASNEGIMPQTIEHFNIMKLLGIKHGIIVLTKCDIADTAHIAKLYDDCKSFFKNSFLEKAPIFRVSSLTGYGIAELKHYLAEALLSLNSEGSSSLVFRLPIDRIFSVKGFGTVVTGTLLDGDIDNITGLCLYPSGKPIRIRALQVYSQKVSKACRGQRVAVNISNLEPKEIRRGNVIAPAGCLTPSRIIEAELTLPDTSSYGIHHNEVITFFHNASEQQGRILIKGMTDIRPGQSHTVKIKLAEDDVFRKGDHFIIRRLSPAITVGGGIITDEHPRRRTNAEYPQPFDNTTDSTDYSSGSTCSITTHSSHQNLFADNNEHTEEIIMEIYTASGYNLIDDSELFKIAKERKLTNLRSHMSVLGRNKMLIALNDKNHIPAVLLNKAFSSFKKLAAEKPVRLSEFKEKTGMSRRNALIILEYWDKKGITSRVNDELLGDVRILGSR